MQKKGLTIFFLCFFTLFSATAFGKDGDGRFRLAFSTFDMSSAGSYTYLGGGIQSMLASRLATRDRIEVLDRTLSDKELSSLKKGNSVGSGAPDAPIADYVVTGSLYALKSGMSIQVVLYPLAVDKEVLRFEAVVKNQDDMLADIERLSGEIAESAFGEKPVAGGVGTTAGEAGGVSGFVTVHPEAAYKKRIHSGTVMGVEGGGIKVSAAEGKKNISLSREMRTFAVGDVDGDGAEEIVVLEGNALELFKIDGKKIVKAGSGGISPALDCHAMNMADLDGDGKMELYVSATEGLEVASLIIGWNKEKGFHIFSENISWYIRPIFIPGKGWNLAGQKRGMERTELLKSGVYLLALDGAGITGDSERLPLPGGVNLFDFVFADLDGDGSPETVAIDKKERMKVFSRSNELLWVSKRTFGGSLMYLGPSRGGAVNERDRKNFTVDEDSSRELIFVPGRLVVADVDHDGRQEIVVNENILSALSVFEKLRIYNDGSIVGLAWDGSALNEAWRTGSFKGYIAGFDLIGLEPGGTPGVSGKDGAKKSSASLYVGHLPKSGSFVGLLPGVGTTELTVYDLEFSPENTK